VKPLMRKSLIIIGRHQIPKTGIGIVNIVTITEIIAITITIEGEEADWKEIDRYCDNSNRAIVLLHNHSLCSS
jgi:hypothetical protein